MLEQLDFETLETIYGGALYNVGQSFDGTLPQPEAAEQVREHVEAAGFSMVPHTTPQGTMDLRYTATCRGRIMPVFNAGDPPQPCEWNG
jgi:hypothetical protein